MTVAMGRGILVSGAGVAALLVGALAFSTRERVDPSFVVPVRRGELVASLTATGTLRPVKALTYRSPVAGRELEILEMAPEGSRVEEGDVLARLDTTDLEREIDRARQELRQAELDLDVAQAESEDARAAVQSASEGEGALSVAEVRTRLQVAGRKADRLGQEYAQLKPLMERGFITREELGRTANEFEQAEEELALARRRAEVAEQLTHPREQRRADLQLVQKDAQLGRARVRVSEASSKLALLRDLVNRCALFARGSGLVVYEENLTVNPRRKVRVGDRVSPSQGIVTIPEVDRMVLEASVSEADVQRVKPGQPAVVYAEAFAGVPLKGTVSRVGALATTSVFRPLDDKRFDVAIDLDPTSVDLRPEMSARADVHVDRRSDVLLAPVNAVFDRGGSFVAHVVRGRGVETRPVRLGESNGRLVEVLDGLHEGDRVLLADPGRGTVVSGDEQAQPGRGPLAHAP